MGAFRARFVLPPLLVPVPLRATVRVGLVALLDTVTFPEAAPAAVGVNVTLTGLDAPAAIEAPQVLVDANGPVAETEDTLAAAPPVLVTVTVWAAEVEPTAWLPKDREVGDAASVALPPELVPVPVRLNCTLTGHEPFAAIEDPHVLVCAKSPLAEIDETDAAELVGLETVTVCAQLVEPVVTEPKFSALGATVTPELG